MLAKRPHETGSKGAKIVDAGRPSVDIIHAKSKPHSARVRGVPDLRRVLPDEVQRAIAAAGDNGLLIRFAWTTGARISEVLAVTVGDLDFGASSVRLQTLKRRGAHF